MTPLKADFPGWQREFYPVPATVFADGEHQDVAVVDHAIRKWTGLLPEHLSRYGLYLDEHGDIMDASDADGETWILNIARGGTCALCQRWYDPGKARCERCPLYRYLGRPCDDAEPGKRSLLETAVAGDPGAMIAALRVVREILDRDT